MIIPPPEHLKHIPELGLPLTSLKGIGQARARALSQKGLHSVLDLLFFMPIRYEDRRRTLAINETEPGRTVLVSGVVDAYGEHIFPKTRKRLFKVLLRDASGGMELLWFRYNKARFQATLKEGLNCMAYGRVEESRGTRRMIHPDFRPLADTSPEPLPGFRPVYSHVEDVSDRRMIEAARQALARHGGRLLDAVPRKITRAMGMPTLLEAVRGIHAPPPDASVRELSLLATPCHRRLLFDRFLGVMMNVQHRKQARRERPGHLIRVPADFSERIRRWFSFEPTGDQWKAIRVIFDDMGTGRPMKRLLHGDVGCGKTAVAAAAAWAAVNNGLQAAIMVPTQVLAAQHQVYFSGLSGEMGFRVARLTGGLDKVQRRQVYDGIAGGAFNLIIGTQALIQPDLVFDRLGLVIIDEQHRFGVKQRSLLDRKGESPHLLVMTATPIPRTLAMTVYADLAVTAIREQPKGRPRVITRLMGKGEKRVVLETMLQRLSRGQQAIVVCPVIEGSEETDLKNALQMHERLKRLLEPGVRVGLLHGRLPSHEKERVLDAFRRRETGVLVGTTVIEVGVHAPGAGMMVIEHPERFGLAQLHQLRGRIGRGSDGGICFLMISEGVSDQALGRLRFLEKSQDGFEIAQKDLETRGQGELTGLRQAGPGELDFQELMREPELLMEAKRVAEEILTADPGLAQPGHRLLRAMIGMTESRAPSGE